MIMLVLAAIGLLSAFLSGLVGMGGAIINYPMLLYIPNALGLAEFTANQISGMIALQVFIAALTGLTTLRNDRVIRRPLLLFNPSIICLV
jgi:uncharacterized membrane protein YfcA